MLFTARKYLSLHLIAEKHGHEAQNREPSHNVIDAYRAILGSNLPEPEKRPERVAQEVLTLLGGGSATTMRVMSGVFFHVITTPHVLNHLRRELDAVMPTLETRPKLEVLEQQVYLVSPSSPSDL